MYPAIYLDGSGGPVEGSVRLDLDELHFKEEDGPTRTWKLGDLLGSRDVAGETHLELPPEADGGPRTKLVVARTASGPGFGAALDASISRVGGGSTMRARRTGRRLGLGSWFIIAAVVVAVGYFAYSALAPKLHVFVPPEREAQLGEIVFDAVSDDWTQQNAPLFAAFADKVMGELRDPESPYDIRVMLVENEDLNAMALPGGRVIVYSGLVAESPSPNALAGVLAHELCHVERRHSLKHLLRAIGILQFAGAAVGGGTEGFEIAETFLEASSGLLVLKHSRLAETDADTLAVEKLKKAGRNAAGLIEFFELVEEKYGDLPGTLGWLSTHPLTEDRIKRVRKLAGPAQGGAMIATKPWMTDEEWAALQAEVGG